MIAKGFKKWPKLVTLLQKKVVLKKLFDSRNDQ